MSSLKELTESGKTIGLEGAELHAFIKEEQARERQERLEVRQAEKERLEADERIRIAKLEIERLERETNLEAERSDREADRQAARDRLELEKLAKMVEEKEKDRQLEKDRIELQLTKEKYDFDCKMQEIHTKQAVEMVRAEKGEADRSSSIFESGKIKGPKLPCFDESKDSIDSYLYRFERYAELQNWHRDNWGIQLSSLLKGKSLEVYSRLPPETAMVYDALSTALLKRFDVTVEGLRKKVRDSNPERGETFEQFGERLKSYHTKWLDLGKVGHTFEELQDWLLRDQFLQTCGKDLATFLKERAITNFGDMTRQADLYADNRGGAFMVVSRGSRSRDNSSVSVNCENQSSQSDNRNTGRSGGAWCFACGKIGHIARDCPKKVAAAIGEEVSEAGQTYGPYWDGGDIQMRGRGRGDRPPRGRARGDGSQRGWNRYGNNNRGRGGFMGACVLGQGVLGGIASGHTKGGLVIQAGWVNGKMVEVLSDSGCNGIVVRRDLVYDDQMLDRKVECRMINGQIIVVPVARISIDTPVLKGKVEAWVLDTPLCDLIVGNVSGVCERMTVSPQSEAVAHAVVTRGQRAEEKKAYPKLKVPEIVGLDKSPSEIRELQGNDETLASCREHVKNRVVKQTMSGETSWVYIKGTLYRQFQGVDGQKHYQLVVPQVLRADVMKMSHKTMMAGHLGIRKTTYRVISEFYWPGCKSDITKFCRSCDMCQHTVPKGRVGKVNMNGRAKFIQANMMKGYHESVVDQVDPAVVSEIKVNEIDQEIAMDRNEPQVSASVERVDEKVEEKAEGKVSVEEVDQSDDNTHNDVIAVDDKENTGIGSLLPHVAQKTNRDVVVEKDHTIQQQIKVIHPSTEVQDVITEQQGKPYLAQMEIKMETPDPGGKSMWYPYHVKSRLPQSDRSRVEARKGQWRLGEKG